jgi:PAS domain S-box-containing protein
MSTRTSPLGAPARRSALERHQPSRQPTAATGPGASDMLSELAARLSLTDHFADLGSWSWDPRSDLLTVTERFTGLLGMRAGEKVTMSAALEAMPAEDAARLRRTLDGILCDGLESCSVDYRLQAADGSLRWLEGYCISVRAADGSVEKVLGLSRDVTARVESAAKAVQTQRELESARDYLRAVTDTMEESMFTLDPSGCVKYINPSAERLLGWSSGELDGKLMHTVAHFQHADGSSFPAEECPIISAATRGKVVVVADDVFTRRDGTLMPVSYTALPFSADAAVEGCVVIFEDITERKAEERRVACDREKLDWASRIHHALAEQRFELYAQPIVECATGRIVQHELLLRMHDPERGVVAPGEFLPVAEELGLIREIDRWVIARAAGIAHQIGAVEVNLSACSIGDPHLVDHIERSIARAGASADLLVFEITETALIDEHGAARTFIERLHRLGCKVALDDFGTGYGGFTYLKQLPIDILKIDTEFVGDLGSDPANRSVVEAVVNLARGFGLKTVGEGVEDAATFELLLALGVDQAQGFHLGRPAPLGQMPLATG